MNIDLRSDTITRPSQEMKEVMMNAELGDDVYSEDPSVNAFESEIKEYFGKQAAVFCPSATMANQIAIRLLTKPQDEVICDKKSHIYLYEGGGIFYNSFVSVKLLESKYGILNASEIEEAINPKDVHFPRTKLISLENTCNKGGGAVYDLETIKDIRALANAHNLNMHLDGARLFNALSATEIDPKAIAENFDTISICFSKGMACPVGSILICPEELEFDARRIRKVLGGGMRQAGILASACSYALKNHLPLLKEDHRRCSEIGTWLNELHYIKRVYPHPTNILLFELENSEKAALFTEYLRQNDVLISSFDANTLRMVTHKDFDDEMLHKLIELLKKWD